MAIPKNTLVEDNLTGKTYRVAHDNGFDIKLVNDDTNDSRWIDRRIFPDGFTVEGAV